MLVLAILSFIVGRGARFSIFIPLKKICDTFGTFLPNLVSEWFLVFCSFLAFL